MYMALVDPHLTHGCEISLDVDLDLLKPLEDVQTEFLRLVVWASASAWRYSSLRGFGWLYTSKAILTSTAFRNPFILGNILQHTAVSRNPLYAMFLYPAMSRNYLQIECDFGLSFRHDTIVRLFR
ncbi:hypothetical protein C8R45DRAFT_257268 [Mycena sanguinolenta]|nr:hypothetical protein C8R45DRAFT_257268 [Mycena sanguinolenta]